MNKKSKYFILITFISILIICIEVIYLQKSKAIKDYEKKEKELFVSIVQLPDLAITTEAMYLRHRSLSDTFSIFKESPELREYFPTSYLYSHSHITNNTPSKVINEE